MSKFKVIETQIEGLLVIEPIVHSDNRGSFAEEYSEEDLQNLGIDAEFIHESDCKLARGILSGLYFQREKTQGRLLRVLSGSVLAVAVDLRPGSRTYGAPWSVEISAENQRMYWIPEKFAHGFLTLEKDTEINFNCTNVDNPKLVSGIIWDDPIITIDWEFERYDIDEKYLRISDRDKRFPTFRSWTPQTLWK